MLDYTDFKSVLLYRIVTSFRYIAPMKFVINGNIPVRSMLRAFMQKQARFASITKRRRDSLILRTMV